MASVRERRDTSEFRNERRPSCGQILCHVQQRAKEGDKGHCCREAYTGGGGWKAIAYIEESAGDVAQVGAGRQGGCGSLEDDERMGIRRFWCNIQKVRNIVCKNILWITDISSWQGFGSGGAEKGDFWNTWNIFSKQRQLCIKDKSIIKWRWSWEKNKNINWISNNWW